MSRIESQFGDAMQQRVSQLPRETIQAALTALLGNLLLNVRALPDQVRLVAFAKMIEGARRPNFAELDSSQDQAIKSSCRTWFQVA